MYKRKCKITFICHGATIYSEDNRLFDNQNYPPLNTNGKEEMLKLVDWLVKRAPKVDKIYTAASLRAIQSAKIIAQAYETDFEIVDDLTSKKAGSFSGYNYEQLEEQHPDWLEEYHADRADFAPENGESLRMFNTRIEQLLKELVAQNISKRIIVVAHPDIIQAAIRHALDIPCDKQTRIYIPTGSATQINYYSDWESLVYCSYVPL